MPINRRTFVRIGQAVTAFALLGRSALAGEPGIDTGSAWRFSFDAVDGGKLALADYRGKAMLVVNTASHCGAGAHPFYRWAAAVLGPMYEPRWNFHKYLVGRDGRLEAAFHSYVEPEDPKLVNAVRTALGRGAPS